ncbi:unnamed protein product [Aphanomyces euteiches]
MYRCQVAGYSKQDLALRQFRDHTRNTHADVKVKKKPLSTAQVKQRHKKALAKYATKTRELNAKKVVNARDIYEIKDAVEGRGVYGHEDWILRVQQ